MRLYIRHFTAQSSGFHRLSSMLTVFHQAQVSKSFTAATVVELGFWRILTRRCRDASVIPTPCDAEKIPEDLGQHSKRPWLVKPENLTLKPSVPSPNILLSSSLRHSHSLPWTCSTSLLAKTWLSLLGLLVLFWFSCS